MGLQIVLGIVMVVSIMPQDTKSALPSQFGGDG
jgi:preprotein translocase subunit SecG